MGHHCDFTSVIKVVRGKVVHEVTAKWKKMSEVVYQEDENGLAKCRYIYVTSLAGYLVTFPGERLNYYYGLQFQDKEKLEECNRFKLYTEWPNQYWELQKIIEKRPDLKYLVRKYRGENPYEFMDLIKKYKINPHIEFLVQNGFNKIANDKRLEKLSKEKITEVCNWVKAHINWPLVTLSQVFFCIKHNVPPASLPFYYLYRYQYDVANYLKKNDISLIRYEEYIKNCKTVHKNLKDDYWRFPSNFDAKEEELILAKAQFIEAQEREKNKKFALISERVKAEKNIDGFTVYVPYSVSDVEVQAEVLHQCLISCDYIGKMRKGKSILVFIKKDEKRIATAEIDYNKKLIQFYGDERNRDNCKPNAEVRNVLNTWLATASITKQSEVSAS